MLPLAGVLYTVVFAAMSVLRREGLSTGFLTQSLTITAVFTVANLLGGSRLHPLAFVLVIYLLTMRVRILLDLGNIFAARGNLATADRIYDLALRLLPSGSERCIVAINRGVFRLQAGDAAAAAAALSAVLKSAEYQAAGVKYRSAAHYNLGVAYNKQGMAAEAAAELGRVLELWPVSEYARKAQALLKQAR